MESFPTYPNLHLHIQSRNLCCRQNHHKHAAALRACPLTHLIDCCYPCHHHFRISLVNASESMDSIYLRDLTQVSELNSTQGFWLDMNQFLCLNLTHGFWLDLNRGFLIQFNSRRRNYLYSVHIIWVRLQVVPHWLGCIWNNPTLKLWNIPQFR